MTNWHRQKRRYPNDGSPRVPGGRPGCLAAVDLGKWKVGVALFTLGRLSGAWTVHNSRRPWDPADTADAILGQLRAFPVDCWVCEWPQAYPGASARQVRDLDTLKAVGNACAAKGVAWAERYQPRQWKGGVPKPIHHSRLRTFLGEDERWAIPPLDEHDAWDAIGIGLYALGRTQKGAIAPPGVG